MIEPPSSHFQAEIDRVDVVEEEVDRDDPLAKGLSMLKARISLLGTGTHVVYNVRILQDGNYRSVPKRFSEFATLHDFLKARFGLALPMELPTKTPIRYFSQDKVEDRKHALNAYLKELCRRGDILELPEVQRFFQGPAPGRQQGGYSQPPSAPQAPASGSRPSYSQSAPPPSDLQAPWRDSQAALRRPHTAATSHPIVVGAPPGKSIARSDSEDDLAGWAR
eukprot:TRINITY_DN11354_c0_g3_i1.p1 TRINITY_DN11354_c0_g3~~TRINITY_DN11354_c0_g3_i1.p1  ORF type:complete len:247 (-),score=36.34 TRINITY_DN11354_c0_g3_i1:142-807(-)